jgi:hypothetical protein
MYQQRNPVVNIAGIPRRRDYAPVRPEYDAGVLTTRPRPSVTTTSIIIIIIIVIIFVLRTEKNAESCTDNAVVVFPLVAPRNTLLLGAALQEISTVLEPVVGGGGGMAGVIIILYITKST